MMFILSCQLKLSAAVKLSSLRVQLTVKDFYLKFTVVEYRPIYLQSSYNIILVVVVLWYIVGLNCRNICLMIFKSV